MLLKSDADVLAEAREYIEKHGWVQHALHNHAGKVCAAGAVIYSQGWNIHELVIGQRAQQYRIEQKLLAATGWKPRSAITLWNDQVGRTQEEVTDLFMKAEKIERSGDVRD